VTVNYLLPIHLVFSIPVYLGRYSLTF